MLSTYRVLDLSDDRGLLCGHVLAQLGAEVIHVESPTQAAQPRSATWVAYARGSTSVVLDLDQQADREQFFDLVRSADAIIESADPGTWEGRGLGFDVLSNVNPALVWTSITAFGNTGPKAQYAATDLIVQAAAGTVDMAGPIDRAPLRTAAITAFAHAGAEAAGGILIALAEAQRSGRGQRVEVSAQRAKNLSAFFHLQSERIGAKRISRTGSGFTLCGVNFPFVYPCADGFVSLTVAIDAGNRPFLDRLLAYMNEEGAIDEDLVLRDWLLHVRSVRNGSEPNTDLQRLVDAISAFLTTQTKADLMAAALDRRLLLVPVSTFEDLLQSPQLIERGFWRDEQTADGKAVRVPGHVVRGAPSVPTELAPAPAPGHHNREILAQIQAAPRLPLATILAAANAADAAGPPSQDEAAGNALEGVKVLDMMWVMAGPTSTGVLAQYGATVVRVENAARIDTVRLLAPWYDGKAGREKSLPFASINAAKLSVTLDPNIPAAREVLLDLVRWADVVTESFSPKAMKGWGLDYESLRKVKPDLIMLSSCLFGQDGPYSLMAGYGTMGAAIGGMVAPTGYPDQPPAGPYGAYTDVCAPRISTAVLMAALEHRRHTGEGAYLDQSQIEASLQYMTPALVDHQLSGRPWDRLGNTDLELSPHGIYPSAGTNEWVAVAVRDQRDWAALCTVLGRPEWAGPELSEAEARRARSSDIDTAISAYTSQRSPLETEHTLQAAGIPAHAVAHGGSAPDPQLEHLRHSVTIPHAGQPDRIMERTRIELSRTPPDPSHVPAMGQHTEQVLRDLLGYDEARLAQLRASGALGGEPNRS